MLDQIVSILDLILSSTQEYQDRAAESVGTFLAAAIPGDQVEDDLARFLRQVADSLENPGTGGGD